MDTALLPLDLRSIEKLREQELEEARVIRNVMPPRILCAKPASPFPTNSNPRRKWEATTWTISR